MYFWWEMIRFLKVWRYEETCETAGLGRNCWHFCSCKCVLICYIFCVVAPTVASPRWLRDSKTQIRPVGGFWSNCRQVSVANGYCERGLGFLSQKFTKVGCCFEVISIAAPYCPTFLGCLSAFSLVKVQDLEALTHSDTCGTSYLP